MDKVTMCQCSNVPIDFENKALFGPLAISQRLLRLRNL